MDVIVQKRTDKITASAIIHNNSIDYMKTVNGNLFPSPIDGLKKVQRRIIWAIRKANVGEWMKSATVVSKALDYHPYGDVSTYEAAIRLLQPFENNFPLLSLNGDCGTYSGDRASQMRYTDMMLSEFTYDLFLNGIDEKTFSLIFSEDYVKLEPEFFIPKLPYALLNGNYAVGCGYKSWTIPYEFSNICSAVMQYAKDQSEGFVINIDYTKYAKFFIPHFPIAGLLRNEDELIKLAKEGVFNHTVLVDGDIVIKKDGILIKSLPPFNKIGNCIDTIMGAFANKDSWFNKNCIDYIPQSETKMSADIYLPFKRTCNIFAAYEYVKNMISGTSGIAPINNYCINQCMVELNPVQVIKAWYRERYNSILKKKKYHQMKLTADLDIIEISLVVQGHIDKVIEIIRSNNDEIGTEKLKTQFNLTTAQALVLRKIPLGQLSKTSEADLLDRKAKLESELKKVRDGYGLINEEIYADAETLKKKYGNITSGTTTPKYIGYVHVNGDGVVHFENTTELLDILQEFHNTKNTIDIVQYDSVPKPNELFISYKNGRIKPGFQNELPPKVLRANNIIHTPNKPKYTACFADGKLSIIDGFGFTSDPKYTLVPLYSNTLVAFYKSGRIAAIEAESLPKRKAIGVGNKSEIIWLTSYKKQMPKAIVYMNNSLKNILSIQLLDDNTNKFPTLVTGETTILGTICNLNKEYVYVLPIDCLHSTTVRYVKLTNLSKLFTNDTKANINVNSGAYKNHKLKRDKNVQAFLTI